MIFSYAIIIKISLSHRQGFEPDLGFDFGGFEKWSRMVRKGAIYYAGS